MKTARKVLILALCAVLLVSTTVMGTLAYLTSKDSVTNTFTVGKVAITMDEAPVNEMGEEKEGDRVQENKYHLLPGHTYKKDPTVHVDEDSEDAYLFVKLVIADNADLTKALNRHELSSDLWDILTGSNQNAWTAFNPQPDAADGSRTYYLAYNTVVKAKQDIVLFTGFTIPGLFTNEDLESIEDLQMDVTAYAIQADGFGTAAEAWAAGGEQATKNTESAQG